MCMTIGAECTSQTQAINSCGMFRFTTPAASTLVSEAQSLGGRTRALPPVPMAADGPNAGSSVPVGDVTALHLACRVRQGPSPVHALQS